MLPYLGYGNGDRMHGMVNGEPLAEVDCLEVEADLGCERDVVHRMNEGYGKCAEQ